MSMEKSPDREALTPAERAAIYKQRRQGGAAPTPASAAAIPPTPSTPAPVEPTPAVAAPAAGSAPANLSSMSPAE